MLIPPPAAEAMVICPGVVVVIVMLDPAIKFVGAYLCVPSSANNCPVNVGSVDVPLPPFATATTPEEVKFLDASVNSTEEAVSVAMLTLPKALTWKKDAPVVDATTRIGKVCAEVDAAINKLPPVGVDELIIKDLAVLSQRKLVEPAVVDAAV